MRKGSIIIVFGFIFIACFPFLVYNLVYNFKVYGKPKLILPKGRCVKPKDYMRKYHMELLKDGRSNAIHKGERGSFTLTSCRRCHIKREEFCNRCHNFVGVKPLCFSCHYYP